MIECIDNTSVENILTRGKRYTALYVTDFSVVVLNDLGTHSGCCSSYEKAEHQMGTSPAD